LVNHKFITIKPGGASFGNNLHVSQMLYPESFFERHSKEGKIGDW